MFTKLNVYSDGFLSYAAAFTISYAVFTYNRLGVFKSLTLATIIGFIAAATLFVIKYFSGNKNGEKARRKNLTEALFFTLVFYSDDELLNLFKNVFKKQNLTAVKSKRFLLITELNAAFCPIFGSEKVTARELTESYKKCPLKKLLVAAKSYDESCFKLAEFKPGAFTLFDENDVFLTLEKLNLLPEIVLGEKEKRTPKTFALKIFKKNNFKKMLISGLIIISLSTISSLPAFFIVAGTIISLGAVAVKLFAPPAAENKGLFFTPEHQAQKLETSDDAIHAEKTD